jgi:hypothetical protein
MSKSETVGVGYDWRPEPACRAQLEEVIAYVPWRAEEIFERWIDLCKEPMQELAYRLAQTPGPDIDVGSLAAAQRAYDQAAERLRTLRTACAERDALVTAAMAVSEELSRKFRRGGKR